MSYSYSQPVSYEQNGAMPYSQPEFYQPVNKNSSAPAAAAGVLVGAVGGGIIGSRKNPYMNKAGEPVDSFAVDVYERYIRKNPEAGKTKYNQGMNILKKLKGIKTADELKELLKNNSEAANDIYTEAGKTADEFLKEVTDATLSGNKDTIKDKINAGNKTRYQDIKNKIVAYWDKESKKFIKPEGADEDVFKAIKNAKGRAKAGMICKYASIGAAITGVAAFLIHSIITSKKNVSKQ